MNEPEGKRLRGATPSPTVPPPNSSGIEATAQVVIKRYGWLKPAAGVVLAVFVAGMSFTAWQARYLTRVDADRLMQDAEKRHVAIDSSVMALGNATHDSVAEISSQIQTLRERAARTDERIEWMAGALYEVARKTGAHGVPPPPK